MTRPADAMLQWVRSSTLPREIDTRIALSAIEHRVGGLMATELLKNHGNHAESVRRLVAGVDMRSQAQNAGLYDLAYRLTKELGEADIEATVLKGIGVEGCWYDRVGERPTSDLDLLVWPDARESVANAVRLIDPDYPHAHVVARLVAAGELQSVDLSAGRHRVDLHFDPLKLGVWTREAELFRQTQQDVGTRDGVTLRTFGPECSLVQLVMHVNKDSFAFLGSFVDVGRVLERSDIDWELVHTLVDANGLRVPFWNSLELIAEVLGIELAGAAPRLPRLRSRLWLRTWSEGHVLLGNEGRLKAPRRQRVLPLTFGGRPRDVLRELSRRLFPTHELYVVQGIESRRVRWARAARNGAPGSGARP